MLILIIMFYIFIGSIELIPLIKKRQKRELQLYTTLISIAFALSILLGLGLDLRGSSDSIKKLVFAVIGK